MGEVHTLITAVLTHARATHGSGARPLSEPSWLWVTASLSALVAIGYCIIAFKWYFQSRLARPSEARGAAVRLCAVLALCAVVGCAFYLLDMPWIAWRLYDVMLLAMAVYTLSFALRTKGLRLMDERLAQMVVLERSAQTYREIAELLPQAIWTATSDGVVDFSNKAWSDYAGGGNVWLEAVHPEEEQEVLRWWHGAVRDRVADRREMRLRGADRYRTFVVSAVPIVKGEAVKWLGACADIEDQRQVAAEKERQAKQKLFFLNALSHDIRAPLNSIMLNAQALSPSSEDDRLAAQTIVENARDAANLVTKLLDFARIGSQDHNDIAPLSLQQLLNHVGRRFAPIAERKGLYLRFEGASDIELCTDQLKLERVMSNLIDNAIKFTPTGGIDIRAMATDDDRVLIQVADTGVGIPASDVPHLFDEFYQVEKHERQPEKGFGLGLAICRCLLVQIGGDVRIVYTGEGGTCFEVTLRGRTRGRVRTNGQRSDQRENGFRDLQSA